MSKVKILIITPWFPSSDNETEGNFVLTQASILSKVYDVRVVHFIYNNKIPRFSWRITHEVFSGIKVERVEYRALGLDKILSAIFVFILYLKLRFNGFVPDIIHAHTWLAGTASLLLKFIFQPPICLTEHYSRLSLPPNKDVKSSIVISRLERIQIHLAYTIVDIVLPVSDSLRKSLLTYYNKGANYKTLYNVVPSYKAKKRKSGGTVRFCVVGTIDARKSSDVILQSYICALPKFPGNTQLVYVGDGVLRRSLESIVREIGQEEKVFFKGRLSLVQTIEEVRNSDVLISYSLYETFGMTIAEAVMVGTPVLVSDIPPFKEIVTQESGVLISTRSVEALSTAMVDMSKNCAQYNPDRMHSLMDAKFGEEVFLANVNEIYSSMIVN